MVLGILERRLETPRPPWVRLEALGATSGWLEMAALRLVTPLLAWVMVGLVATAAGPEVTLLVWVMELGLQATAAELEAPLLVWVRVVGLLTTPWVTMAAIPAT